MYHPVHPTWSRHDTVSVYLASGEPSSTGFSKLLLIHIIGDTLIFGRNQDTFEFQCVKCLSRKKLFSCAATLGRHFRQKHHAIFPMRDVAAETL